MPRLLSPLYPLRRPLQSAVVRLVVLEGARARALALSRPPATVLVSFRIVTHLAASTNTDGGEGRTVGEGGEGTAVILVAAADADIGRKFLRHSTYHSTSER